MRQNVPVEGKRSKVKLVSMIFYALAAVVVFMIVERIVPDQKLPAVKGWWSRVILINFLQGSVVVLAAYTWDDYLRKAKLTDFGANFSPFVGGFLGYFILTFIYYWWHRVRHTNNFLWLTMHQIHHSPSRIETITSFYKHPLEILVNNVLINTVCYIVLGFSIEQLAWTNLFAAIGEYLYHMNIKTPHWWGYFFQRPEMHRVHHQRGLHFYNFADLPIWDMMFGTYRNPKEHYLECGYHPEREAKLKEMFFFKNVNGPYKKKKTS